jgi:HPt (histidine-containing phosphotransfer) domain-containing protein
MNEFPVFDRTAAFERIDNDGEFYKELVSIFFEDYPQAQKTLNNDDTATEELIAVAHSLKSALGNIGAMQAFAAAKTLEDALRQAGRSSETQGQIESLLSAIAEFRSAVEVEFLSKN